MRNIEKYRIREEDDVLVKENFVHDDIDRRLDAVEQDAEAFRDGNRIDVDALVRKIGSDFADLAFRMEQLLDETSGGISAGVVQETAERLFLTPGRRAAILDELRDGVDSSADTMAKLLAFVLDRPTAAALSAALVPYAAKESPALSGTPTAPTPSVGAQTQQIATAAMVTAAVGALKDFITNGAGGALDQFNEFAAAIGNDANYAATVLNLLAGKASLNGHPSFGATTISGAYPYLHLTDTDGAANRKTVRFVNDGGALAIGVIDDAGAWARGLLGFTLADGGLEIPGSAKVKDLALLGGGKISGEATYGRLTFRTGTGNQSVGATLYEDGWLSVSSKVTAVTVELSGASAGLKLAGRTSGQQYEAFAQANFLHFWSHAVGKSVLSVDSGGTLRATTYMFDGKEACIYSDAATNNLVFRSGSTAGGFKYGSFGDDGIFNVPALVVGGRRVYGSQALDATFVGGGAMAVGGGAEQAFLDLVFTATGPRLHATASAQATNTGASIDLIWTFRLYDVTGAAAQIDARSVAPTAQGGWGGTGVMSLSLGRNDLTVGRTYLLRIGGYKAGDNGGNVTTNALVISGMND